MRRCGGILVLVALLVSCRSALLNHGTTPADVRLFAESRGPDAMPWVLPQSGVRILCDAEPIVDATDITSIDVVTLELGTGLMLKLTPRGASALAARQATAPHARLVLVVNNAALGVVRLDGAVLDGRLVLFVEMPESQLPALVQSLRPGLGPRRSHSLFSR